jgi:SPP1 gp7 family putative phage head morphogenesis protein
MMTGVSTNDYDIIQINITECKTMNAAELLKLQLASTTKRKPRGVKQALQVGSTYHTDMLGIARNVHDDVNKHILTPVDYNADASFADIIVDAIELVRGKWSSPRFKSLAQTIARKFVNTANKTNKTRNKRYLGIDLFSGNKELLDYVDASIYDNVRLIESIPSQYLAKVDSIVMTNIRAGNRPGVIAKELLKQFDITESRAKLIARDQTAKINGQLNKLRQVSAGFPYFEWIDSGDERVRHRHSTIADKVTKYGKGIYRWEDPPLSDRGTPIIPGEDFQCRCIARPVGQDEVDSNR